MIKLRLSLFILMAMVVSLAKSQTPVPDTLSTDSELFYQQLTTILMGTPSKTWQKKSKVLLERFYAGWSVGRFNKEEKEAIRGLVQKMRDKKVRAYPNLYQYIYSLTLLSESHQPPASILAWHRFASQLLDEKTTKNFLRFLKTGNGLFEKRQIYKTKSSFAWYYRNGRFRFHYDSVFTISFTNLNLVCATKRDSVVILNTSGVFNYNNERWKGTNGKITWQRFGEKQAKATYAVFDAYSIYLNHNYFTVDSARLYYSRFFKQPLLGQLREKVLSSPPSDHSVYPIFTAYENGIEMGEVYPNLDLKCNLELKGKNLYGIGSDNQKALVTVKLRDEVYARFLSDQFKLSDDKLESPHTEFIFYLEGDSIYHPDLRLRYLSKKNEMVLFSSLLNSSNHIPFYDSYHKMDIDVPALYWNMNDDKLYLKKFKKVRGDNVATFESSNYFSLREFYSFQVMDQKNPLYVIDGYLKQYASDGSRLVEVPLLADYMNMPPEQAVAMLVQLSNRGFVVYNSKTRTAVVKNKLFYYLFAKSGQSDYDVIHFVSKVRNKPNAIIDLNTLDLDIFGVPKVKISDSQAVYIFPYDKTVSVKKNRDFSFDGKVRVGLFDFYSHNSMFIYDSFMLNLNYIDTMQFYLVKKDTMQANRYYYRKVNNVITQLNGQIYIDNPKNKSGLHKFPKFPVFVSKDYGYVYYNRKSIQDSTLVRERFYYKVDPFVFDSVSAFSTTGLAFKGSLMADGIIPVIHEPLIVMPDYSLGFVHQTPDTGYAVYNGKARFFNTLQLDNNGFRGSGRVDYLNATFNSPDLVFYPDSLKGIGYNFVALADEQRYNTPDVHGDSIQINWDVDSNMMTLTTLDTAHQLVIYNNTRLNGSLFLSPEFMHGEGAFTFDRSEVLSSAMDFKYNTMSADSADFTLFDETGLHKIFISKGYFAQIDFKNALGEFEHLYKGSFVELPYNRYISTLDQVKWLMDEDKLELSGEQNRFFRQMDSLSDFEVIDKQLSGPEFVSIDPTQDSLRFFAGKALYDLNNYTINAEGVRFIKTADAAVFPANKSVRIYQNARMDTLYNAYVITDTLYKYHKIYDAMVAIQSRKAYGGEGYVDYIDRNGLPQQIYLPEIKTNQWGRTIATGRVKQDELFFLSPEYFFQGAITLEADKPYLKFTGGYRLNEECIGLEDNWVAFSRFINPKHVQFEVDTTTVTTDSARARFGLALSMQRRKFYPMVLQSRESADDIIAFESYGKLEYDKDKNTYLVGSEARLQGNLNAKGNFISLNNKRCVLSGDGLLDLGTNFTQTRLIAAGGFTHYIIPDSTTFNTSLIFDFYFDDDALNMMLDSLRMIPGDVVNVEKSEFNVAIRELLNKEDADVLKRELSLYGNMKKMPKQIKGSIIFSDVNLIWDPDTRSYISNGPIGIGFINGSAVNKMLKGFMQIELGRVGSSIHFYLETDRKTWYFFSYQNGIMQSISSDMNYNEHLAGMKDEKRMKNPDSDEDYYEYVISTKRKKVDFFRRMELIKKRMQQ